MMYIQQCRGYRYVTNIIGEPNYKYGQQEQVTERNHNRSIALEQSVLKYWGGGGTGLKPVLRDHNLVLSFCFEPCFYVLTVNMLVVSYLSGH